MKMFKGSPKVGVALCGLLLASCAKQAPVAVIDGFSGQRYKAQQSESANPYDLQSEAILTSQNEQKYYVHGGDNLSQIAKHYGVTEEAIWARNNLPKGSDLPVGETIIIPDVTWQVPEAQRSAYKLTDKYRTQTEEAAEGYNQPELDNSEELEIVTTETVVEPKAKINLMREHVLKPGENIFRLALKYRVSQFDILAANNISKPDDLKPGMVIQIPPAGERVDGREAYRYLAEEQTTTAEVPVQQASAQKVTIPKKPAMRTDAALAQAKKAPQAVTSAAQQAEKTTTMATAAATAAVTQRPSAQVVDYAQLAEKYGSKKVSGRGMIWPAEGKVVKTFGNKGRGITNSGINIELAMNAPIYAAESGTVLYAGDGLEVYGNLILIKHTGGLVTAYAHNSKNLVKRHQKIAKGDLIAFAGNTGNVETPQLHFEVRKNTQPTDPLRYLPKR